MEVLLFFVLYFLISINIERTLQVIMQNGVSHLFEGRFWRKTIYFMSMTRLKMGIESMSRDENSGHLAAIREVKMQTVTGNGYLSA